MAFLLTHCYIAKEVLKKLKKRSLVSNHNNIDDYYFGAIAPDIRYVNNSPREFTHNPKGNDSVLEYLKNSDYSKAFLAGYETHLITDKVWSNSAGWIDKSIYEFYKVNPEDAGKKFSLYFAVDRYFKSKADWYNRYEFSGNVFRSDEFDFIRFLGFNEQDILIYKSLSSIYLREPGLDVFDFLRILNMDDLFLKEFEKSLDFSFLNTFEKIAINKTIELFEEIF